MQFTSQASVRNRSCILGSSFPSFPIPPLPDHLPFSFPFSLSLPKIVRALEEPYKLPSGPGAEYQPKSNFVHYSSKIWHITTAVLVTFVWICSPNCRRWHILGALSFVTEIWLFAEKKRHCKNERGFIRLIVGP